jgi:hypothetical protein
MRRTTIAALLALLVLGMTASTAAAQNVHLKGGAGAEPSFTDGGLNLSAAGELAGLGGGDVRVELTAQANVDATCTNPAGATQPPGQNPAPISVSGVDEIPETEIKNGNTPFDVTTTGPVTPIPGAPDCPNRRWTEDINDLAFTSAKIEVFQAGVLVLTVDCTFSTPTTDGAVPGGNVSCTQS